MRPYGRFLLVLLALQILCAERKLFDDFEIGVRPFRDAEENVGAAAYQAQATGQRFARQERHKRIAFAGCLIP